MKSSRATRASVAKVLGIMTVAGLVAGALSSRAMSAQPGPAATRPTFESQEAWRAFMAQVPMPQKGCFTATYPDTAWHEVPCTTAPKLPFPPARGPRSNIIGDGTDYSALVSGTSRLSIASGSFARITGVKSESGYVDGAPPAEPNAYTLQLNSNFFSSAACSGAANPSDCYGWQQFVLSNRSCECAFMQYWLINYGTTNCPANWLSYPDGDEDDCYTNSNAVSTPVQPIANLRNMSMTGKAVSGGNDTLILSTGDRLYTVQNADSVVYLALGWQAAEFNIFGDCCGSEANFNTGSTIVVRTRVDAGSAKSPACLLEGFTGETNNLSRVKDPIALPLRAPLEILFMESNNPSGKLGEYCYSTGAHE